MQIAAHLRDHVYTAIVLGSIFEGETTVVLAGFAAHQGYAPWWAVTLLAAVMNFVLDQGWFALGRWRGDWVLARWPRLRPSVDRVAPYLQRHRRWVVFGVRFLYGLRTAGPLALGMSRISWRDFVVFNALGAAVWAVTFTTLGFLFGRAISAVIGEIVHYEAELVLFILAAGLVWFAVWRIRLTRRSDRA